MEDLIRALEMCVSEDWKESDCEERFPYKDYCKKGSDLAVISKKLLRDVVTDYKAMSEELQKYREIGTPERFEQLSEQLKPHVTDSTCCQERGCNKCDGFRKEVEQYRQIGTIEECRAAREAEFPCRVGDIVYVVANCEFVLTHTDTETGFRECPYEADCDYEECDDENKRVFKTEVDAILCDSFGLKISLKNLFLEALPISEFGKIVFLTQKQAEQALLERESAK